VYEHPEASEKEFPLQKHWTWHIFVFDLFWFYLVSWCIVLMLSNRFEDFYCQGEASHVVQWGQQGALARHIFFVFRLCGFCGRKCWECSQLYKPPWLVMTKTRSGPRFKTSSTSWITSGCPYYWVRLREVSTHTHKELKAFRRHGNRVGPIKATHLNQLDTVTAALEAAAAGNKVALMCKFATIYNCVQRSSAWCLPFKDKPVDCKLVHQCNQLKDFACSKNRKRRGPYPSDHPARRNLNRKYNSEKPCRWQHQA